MTDFPILDSPRTGDPFTYPGRAILDYHGHIEPYLDEADYWVAMPVRLVHTQGAGYCIELGPYTLDRNDIERLRTGDRKLRPSDRPTSQPHRKECTMTDRPPLGSPDNELTKRAPVDAILLAQAFHRDDDAAQQVVLKNCDPHSVALQLCGFLFATFRQFDVNIDERLAIWLEQTRAEVGEDPTR